MRTIAARLMGYEANGSASAEPARPAVFHVCERLRPHLSTLMGKGGFCAVLSRALAVAKSEALWLQDLRVTAEGSLEGWESVAAPAGEAELTEGGTILVTQVLGLLVAFIGEGLTLRLVGEVWPKLPPEK